MECFWGVGLIFVFSRGTEAVSDEDAAPEVLEASLAERLISLQNMPKPLLQLAKEPSSAAPPTAAQLLAAADEPLSKHLASRLGGAGVASLLLPIAQRFCVGTLSLEAMAFVWDLCLLAGWQQLQPALSAMLICLREGLLACADGKAATSYMQQHAQDIAVVQLQAVMQANFMPAIRKAFGASNPADILTLTPGSG